MPPLPPSAVCGAKWAEGWGVISALRPLKLVILILFTTFEGKCASLGLDLQFSPVFRHFLWHKQFTHDFPTRKQSHLQVEQVEVVVQLQHGSFRAIAVALCRLGDSVVIEGRRRYSSRGGEFGKLVKSI